MRFPYLVFWLAGLTLAKVSSVEPNRVVEVRSRLAPAPAIAPLAAVNPPPAPSRAPGGALAPRPLLEWQLADFVLVSTVDGSLQARDRKSGSLIWALAGDSLVEINSFDDEGSETGEYTHGSSIWLADPSDGGRLMHFNKELGLEQITASVKDLVEGAPFGLVDNVMYTGSKSTTMYAINATNGELVHAFGTNSTSTASPRWVSTDVILMGRTEYLLHIQESDMRHWHLRIAHWVPNSRDLDLQAQYAQPLDGLYVSALTNSTAMATQRQNGFTSKRWINNVSSLLINSFDVLTPRNHPGRGFAVVSQPSSPISLKSAESNEIFVDETAQGLLVAVSGPRFETLLASNAIASWCTHGGPIPRSLIGVHPQWCQAHYQSLPKDQDQDQDQDQYPGHMPDNSRLPVTLLPAIPGSSPISSPHLLDPPSTTYPHLGPIDTTASSQADSWKRFVVRVGENLVSVVLMLAVAYFAAYQGWVPGFADTLVILASKLHGNSPPQAPLAVKDGNGETSKQVLNDSATPDVYGPLSGNSGQQSSSPDGEGAPHMSDMDDYAPDTSPGEISAVNNGPKKRKRGARGGRKAREAKERLGVPLPEEVALTRLSNGLQVSEKVLGYGSHGTTVLKGIFESRAVAVKRMLLSFYDVASQEVTILSQSDDHPNVVRYFCKQQTDQFLYIALELCPGTLEDLIKAPPGLLSKLRSKLDPVDALRQITLGLQHLHSLNIVHRDIKPQNILVAQPKHPERDDPDLRLLISDFGLCRRLEMDQSSFQPTHTAQGGAAGTAGWTAPEIGRYTTKNSERLTRAVDIFSLGCLYYYVMCPGKHPFGDNSARQLNIDHAQANLDDLTGPKAAFADDLISQMISTDPQERPDLIGVLKHPFYWTDRERLDFLVKVSDRLEHDSREEFSSLLARLEADAASVVGTDWHQQFPPQFVENLGKYRRYRGDRILDLLRALRNKLHHYNDFSTEMQQLVGSVPSDYLNFFTSRFPLLEITVYRFAFREFRDEIAFREFFPKPSSKNVSLVVADTADKALTSDDVSHYSTSSKSSSPSLHNSSSAVNISSAIGDSTLSGIVANDLASTNALQNKHHRRLHSNKSINGIIIDTV